MCTRSPSVPESVRGAGWTRTTDRRIMSSLLDQRTLPRVSTIQPIQSGWERNRGGIGEGEKSGRPMRATHVCNLMFSEGVSPTVQTPRPHEWGSTHTPGPRLAWVRTPIRPPPRTGVEPGGSGPSGRKMTPPGVAMMNGSTQSSE